MTSRITVFVGGLDRGERSNSEPIDSGLGVYSGLGV